MALALKLGVGRASAVSIMGHVVVLSEPSGRKETVAGTVDPKAAAVTQTDAIPSESAWGVVSASPSCAIPT